MTLAQVYESIKGILDEHGAVTQEILVESLGSELGGSTQISLGIA